jgi:transcriptional regulator with XRE-family HTH domain
MCEPSRSRHFARRLRQLRAERSLSQAALARAAGVSLWTVFQLENKPITPRPSTVRKLAAALDIEPSEMISPDAYTRRPA